MTHRRNLEVLEAIKTWQVKTTCQGIQEQILEE